MKCIYTPCSAFRRFWGNNRVRRRGMGRRGKTTQKRGRRRVVKTMGKKKGKKGKKGKKRED
jgi:hypothetical protein